VEPRLRHTSGNAGTSSNLRYWLKRQANGLTKNVRPPPQWFTRHLELCNNHSGSHDSHTRGQLNMRTSLSEPLLTPGEVAAMFRVDPKTVTRWARDGKLTSIRTLGGHRRYREAEIRTRLGSWQYY
jgi:excisionase family DNA binding protein